MRLYLDCEFNGFGGELISMALCAEDGREWYAVLPEPSLWNEWVFENVLPVISAEKPTIYANSREEFRVSLRNFLDGFEQPTIVADWYTDLVHFFQSFAGRDHTESIDYPCKAELVTDVPGYAPAVPHNALSDARAIRDALGRDASSEPFVTVPRDGLVKIMQDYEAEFDIDAKPFRPAWLKSIMHESDIDWVKAREELED